MAINNPEFCSEEMEKSLNIDVMRHGKAGYKEEHTSFEEARDLTPEGSLNISSFLFSQS